MTPALCGRGTFNGEAAKASKYNFAPCIREKDHAHECDSGPAPLEVAA